MNGKVANRATVQPFKDRELKTLRNHNSYILRRRQQSDYRATLKADLHGRKFLLRLG